MGIGIGSGLMPMAERISSLTLGAPPLESGMRRGSCRHAPVLRMTRVTGEAATHIFYDPNSSSAIGC